MGTVGRFFALGGFAGNFVLTLTDHAQNGFFQPAEWIPVVSSALGVGFLLLALFEQETLFWGACLAVMVLQAIVGVTGFALHLSANVNGLSSSLYENFIHGAPLLAPLLFVKLALLAVIGLFDRGTIRRRQSRTRASEGGGSRYRLGRGDEVVEGIPKGLITETNASPPPPCGGGSPTGFSSRWGWRWPGPGSRTGGCTQPASCPCTGPSFTP